MEMGVQHASADLLQRPLDGHDLVHHVDAVGALLHHALHTAHMAFDALQPADYVLGFRGHALRSPLTSYRLTPTPLGGVASTSPPGPPAVKRAPTQAGGPCAGSGVTRRGEA